MRVYDTFTTVFKVWKDIATILPIRDAVVNIFGQLMDIRLGNSDNRLIQALTERWWPTTHMFLFPCMEIRVTPLDFTMLTSLSIGRYRTQVPYDDIWYILSNARQLLPNIDFSHIESGNINIAHLRTYLTVAADQEDDITIARSFILFMIGHLWFQMANDTVPLGYLAAVANLDSAAQYDWGSAILASLYHGLDTAITTGGAITGFVQLLTYWFYEYCGVDHPIVKEEADTTLATARLRRSPGNLESARDAQWFKELEDELAIAHMQIDSIDHQLYAHDLQLRRGRDVRVVPLPPGGGARTRQRGSGPQTRGDNTSRRGRGTRDDYELIYVFLMFFRRCRSSALIM
ncbi:hypothetical protein GIB67_003454 [Kingdonia uniflora]|uniref:Aminotransferase-like plant mobile domain-containing protein n=1 Tax=Kingdonia uniflora TaxID=39325 RepID=A0A7J7P975_9MAGN|nr:hypothetical protein GIB67_003454 [Kingdonia uniflora]